MLRLFRERLLFVIIFSISLSFLGGKTSFGQEESVSHFSKPACNRASLEFRKHLSKEVVDCSSLDENEKERVFQIKTNDNKKYTIRYLKNIEGLPDVKSKDAEIEVDVAKSLSSAGVAPKLLYVSLEDGVVISEFIENKSFCTRDGYVSRNFVKSITENLKKMQKQKFPLRDNIFDRMENRLQKAKTFIPKEEFQLTQEALKDIRFAFAKHKDIGAAHRDLMFNVLISKDKDEAFFIDFESASEDDIYYDIASVIVYFLYKKENEEFFIKNYFEHTFNKEKKAKLFLAKQLVLLYGAIRAFVNHERLGDIHKNFVLEESKKKSYDFLMKEREKSGKFTRRTIEDSFILADAIFSQFIKNIKSDEFKKSLEILNK